MQVDVNNNVKPIKQYNKEANMKIKTLLAVAMMSLLASASSIDAYDFTMNLKIPRVYDNT